MGRFKKLLGTLIVLVIIAVISGACSSRDNFRDIEGVKSERPDLVRVFNNVDKHPNLVLVCIEGAGFLTTTRNYGDAVTRVVEWDVICKSNTGKR